MNGPASPRAAIGWELARRHRWGLLGLGVYLVVLAVAKAIVVGMGIAVRFTSPESFALVVVVPITSGFTYLLAVLTYGLSGDIASRESMYPARIFTLPVSTAALAGWPMLYGTIAISALWTATRVLVIWPSDFQIPTVWPALLAASLVAWTQALTWMPYGLRGMRVIVTVFWLAVIDSVVLLALYFKAPEWFMIAFLAPLIPLAYGAAYIAVARARRGVVPDWSGAIRSVGSIVPGIGGQRREFRSAGEAQAWFEWRRHGRTLPALVAMLLPCELLLLYPAKDSSSLTMVIVAGVCLTPPFMAAFVAATVRTPDGSNDGLAPFLATRPVTSPTLIAAKLRMTIRSTLATWALVLVAVPLGLYASGSWPMATERLHRLAAIIGVARVVVLGALVVFVGALLTWRQLVQSLYIGLTGRDWLVKASVMATLVFLTVLAPIADWVVHTPRVEGFLWDGIPAILGLLVLAKTVAAGQVAVRLHESRLLRDRALIITAAGWCIAALTLYAIMAWFMDEPLFANYVLLLIAILLVPLPRVWAAPLALDWNRHR